jgi:hypothetical protein
MLNREELRQKGGDRSQKTTCPEREKKYFQKGGDNYRFGQKYRPCFVVYKIYAISCFLFRR